MSQKDQNSSKAAASSSSKSSSSNLPSVSLIVTTLNEAGTINLLLTAIAKQTHQPDETIIVDGGSQDRTTAKIKKIIKTHQDLNIKLKQKQGLNISQGRNLAIRQAKHDLIAITDAGCIPHKDWLENLLEKYQETKAPVIAGYYQGQPNTAFEQAVVPFVLVMPDQLDYTRFLPASRSMLLTKQIWKQLGGFREDLQVSEDFAFANKLKRYHIKTAFARDAVVAWLPRSDISEFFTMIFRFARGDIRANIIRPRVLLVFLRYWIGLAALIWTWPNLLAALSLILIVFSIYSLWAINKNKKYVPEGWHWLPVLQITADLAVILGSLTGLISLVKKGLINLLSRKKI